MKNFKLDFDASLEGTCLRGYITTTFPKMIAAFGKPCDSDGFKVSGEWIFSSEDGTEVFTVYDWKSSSLYNPELPSPEALRQSDIPFDFNIGGHKSANEFREWLEDQLATEKTNYYTASRYNDYDIFVTSPMPQRFTYEIARDGETLEKYDYQEFKPFLSEAGAIRQAKCLIDLWELQKRAQAARKPTFEGEPSIWPET